MWVYRDTCLKGRARCHHHHSALKADVTSMVLRFYRHHTALKAVLKSRWCQRRWCHHALKADVDVMDRWFYDRWCQRDGANVDSHKISRCWCQGWLIATWSNWWCHHTSKNKQMLMSRMVLREVGVKHHGLVINRRAMSSPKTIVSLK